MNRALPYRHQYRDALRHTYIYIYIYIICIYKWHICPGSYKQALAMRVWRTSKQVSKWVSEWVNAWVSGWVSKWVSKWICKCMYEWVSEWVSASTRVLTPNRASHVTAQAGSIEAKHHVQTINLEPYNFHNTYNIIRFVFEVYVFLPIPAQYC